MFEELQNAQNQMNQMIDAQQKQARKMWWRKNWWWVAGASLLVVGGVTYTIIKAKKK
jgi:hypothetical protein